MIVEFGNPSPIEFVEGTLVNLPGPSVTSIIINPNQGEDGVLRPGYIVGTDANEILRHVVQNPGPLKHLGGNELLQDVLGDWDRHCSGAPSWVSVKEATPYPAEVAEDFERCVSEYWNIPRGAPEDLEDTHFTQYGRALYAPGSAPEVEGATDE